MEPPQEPSRSPFRRWALSVVLCAGVVVLLVSLGRHYSPADWLVVRYAIYLLLGATWSVAIFAAGHRLYRWLEPHPLPLLERATMAFASGVVAFFLVMFAGGVLGLFHPVFAVVLPIAMAALGGRQAFASWKHVVARLRRARFTSSRSSRAFAAGTALAIALVYFSILSPENPGFDTRWYHLPIAEQYAALGAIRPFAEGWYYGAYPQLASILYTWPFLLPGAGLFDRVSLAAHLEFFVFLGTLLGTAALTDRLLRRGRNGNRRRIGVGVGATFLFPGILLYDGGLFTAADHVLAFFAVALVLAWFRLVESPAPGRAALFGTMAGAMVATKYQAAWILPLPLLATGVTLLVRRFFAELAIAAGASLACAAPHWLKNWVAYGDPVYPLGAAWFRPHPWSEHAARLVHEVFSRGFWPAEGSVGEKVGQIARVLFTFSFEPHDWPTYHGVVPVFGSMFTLLFFAVPFVRVTRRLLGVMAFTYASIAGWYWVSHQDRYLQALIPWMAAFTAATMLELLRYGPRVRGPLYALMAVQLAWGSGVFFIHARDDHYEIDRPSPLAAAVELLGAGYEGTLEQKLSPYEPWPSIGRALPKGAKALVHERFLRLGLGAASVTDLPGSQAAIDYEELLAPRAIYDRLASLGVTHVVWETKTSHGNDSIAADFAFLRFLETSTVERREIGGFSVAKMAPPTDAAAGPGTVLVVDCADPAQNGELDLPNLSRQEGGWNPDALSAMRPVQNVAEREAEAGLLLLRSADRRCYAPNADDGWIEAARRKGDALWLKRRPSAPRPAAVQTAGTGSGAGR